jgi:hypothetical protein
MKNKSSVLHPSVAEKHPSTYKGLSPNFLISSLIGLQELGGKGNLEKRPLTPLEYKVLYYVWSFNHKLVDDSFFRIPLTDVFAEGTLKSGNRNTTINKLRSTLHSRIIFLNRDVTKELLNREGEATISIFNTVIVNKSYFEVGLHPSYKLLLKALDWNGYTRLDRETVMKFNHQFSYILYPRVRQWQAKVKKHRIEIKELRELFYLGEKDYQRWDIFKDRILDEVMSDFKDTWAEFTYQLENPKKAIAIIMTFKKGPMDEKDVPVGSGYKWESLLKRYGVYDHLIIKIRNLVKNQEQHSLQWFLWDEKFVRFSIEGFMQELISKNKNGKRKAIKSIGAYLYEGLMAGYWIEFVKKKKDEEQGLMLLDGFSESDLKIRLKQTPMEQIKEDLQENSKPEDESMSWRALWDDLSADPRCEYKSYEEFMRSMGYIELTGEWVKKS